ncbi:MAG: T9SS type A sorting domain-containing protein [Candidatus Lokiarchaeota archaeon]|nr:T9SS type A sorting domain-containing protein [Candidatus Lokiarchaeota archaeon]
MPQSAFVELKVYNVLGQEIVTIVNSEKPAGFYEVEFNAEDLPSGVYIYRIQAGDYVSSKKMVLVK